MAGRIVRATPEHLLQLLGRLRGDDRREIWNGTGRHSDNVLQESFWDSDPETRYALVVDGRCEALAGVCPLSEHGVGSPWMLCSEEAEEHWALVTVRGRGIIREWLTRYPRLMNWIDRSSRTSIEFILLLGFDVSKEPEPMGPWDWLFHRFNMEAE